jgi:hypothetical protein
MVHANDLFAYAIKPFACPNSLIAYANGLMVHANGLFAYTKSLIAYAIKLFVYANGLIVRANGSNASATRCLAPAKGFDGIK